MKLLRSIASELSALFRRPHLDREMDDELRSHIRHRADDLERSGIPRTEAQRRARIEFGGYERYKVECHEATGGQTLETILYDLRFGLRMLRKSPCGTNEIRPVSRRQRQTPRGDPGWQTFWMASIGWKAFELPRTMTPATLCLLSNVTSHPQSDCMNHGRKAKKSTDGLAVIRPKLTVLPKACSFLEGDIAKMPRLRPTTPAPEDRDYSPISLKTKPCALRAEWH